MAVPFTFPLPMNENFCTLRIVYFLNFEATLNLLIQGELSPIYVLKYLLETFFLFLQIGLECNPWCWTWIYLIMVLKVLVKLIIGSNFFFFGWFFCDTNKYSYLSQWVLPFYIWYFSLLSCLNAFSYITHSIEMEW